MIIILTIASHVIAERKYNFFSLLPYAYKMCKQTISNFSLLLIICLSLLLIKNMSVFASHETVHFIISNDNPLAVAEKKYAPQSLYEKIESFTWDPIIGDLIEALADKKTHIFISYRTWHTFSSLQKKSLALLEMIDIQEPRTRIISNYRATLSWQDAEQFITHKKLMVNEKSANSGKKARFKTSLLSYQHPNQTARILNPILNDLLIPLLIFDPSQWQIYDTKRGLFYLTPAQTPKASIVCKSSRKIWDIKKNLDLEHLSLHQEFLWAESLEKIMRLKKDTRYSFYFAGHGTPDSKKDGEPTGFIAGIPTNYFKKALNNLEALGLINTIYINSCYTPVTRIYGLLDKPCSFTCISACPDNSLLVSALPTISIDCFNAGHPPKFSVTNAFDIRSC